MVLDGLLILIIIFSYSFGVILSFATGYDQSFILKIIAIISVLYSCYKAYHEYQLNKNTNIKSIFYFMSILYVIIILWMLVTVKLNGYITNVMQMYLLSFGSKAITGIILGYIICKNNNYVLKIEKWLEPFSIFYTIILLWAIYKNTTGSVRDLEVNRQTLSYAAAYSVVLLMYINFNKFKQFYIFDFRVIKWLNWFIIIIDFYILFAGGGRGAFVLTFIIFSYYIYKELKYSKLKILICLVLALFFILMYIFIGYFQSIASGYNMITSSFNNRFSDRSSMQRLEMYKAAFQYAKQSSFLGLGAGATAYTIGIYSHNIFFDILLEYGIIGLFISFVVFYKTIKNYFTKGIKCHHIEMIFLFFLCSFIMLQFSGSWYSDTMLWFSVTVLLSLGNGMLLKRHRLEINEKVGGL